MLLWFVCVAVVVDVFVFIVCVMVALLVFVSVCLAACGRCCCLFVLSLFVVGGVRV